MTTTNEQEDGPKTCQPEREPRVEAEIGCRLKGIPPAGAAFSILGEV
jgi:hypothetical protein